MSTLGAPGWSIIGRRFAVALYVAVILVLILLLLVLLAILIPVLRPILRYPAIGLAVIIIIVFFGSIGAVLWIGIKDLAHNFYINLRTGGAGAAWRGLKSDITTCGRAFRSAFVQKVRELTPPIAQGLDRVIGGIKKALGF